VVVIEGDEPGEAGEDRLRRPDRPGRVMAARVRRAIAALQELHRLHDDELVEPLLGQGKPAADIGAVFWIVGELKVALLILQPLGDAG
jgi:hypothetical protein